jgi:ribosomal protein S27AE
MIIYNKRSNSNKRVIAERRAQEFEAAKECPACSGALKIAELHKDRTTYVCTKCGEVATFTSGPKFAKPPKSKHATAITLRDRTTKAYKGKSDGVSVYKDVKDILTIVRRAMSSICVISFEYVASDGAKSARSVEPYKLTLKGGEPILYGYDLDAGSIRIFKLAGMSAMEVQQYLFKPRWEMEDKLDER